MHSLVGQNFGLALVNDDESSDAIEVFATRLHCVIQSVNDRLRALEIARRSRPIVVVADGALLREHLQDFISRIRARWPTLEIIIIRDGSASWIMAGSYPTGNYPNLPHAGVSLACY